MSTSDVEVADQFTEATQENVDHSMVQVSEETVSKAYSEEDLRKVLE